jgi:hypothetical protein
MMMKKIGTSTRGAGTEAGPCGTGLGAVPQVVVGSLIGEIIRLLTSVGARVTGSAASTGAGADDLASQAR